MPNRKIMIIDRNKVTLLQLAGVAMDLVTIKMKIHVMMITEIVLEDIQGAIEAISTIIINTINLSLSLTFPSCVK